MASGPSEARRDQASALLDEITFGGYSQDGAVNAVAVALDLVSTETREQMDARMAEAEEKAVYDFLQWLTTRDIQLAVSDDDYGINKIYPPGELLERWKTERREG
jgi:hypothetical protein